MSERTRVFVHDIFSLTYFIPVAPRLPELDAYAERALLLADPQDVVCVLEPVEPEYLRFLGRLGLGPDPSRVVVVGSGPRAPGRRLNVDLARDRGALARIAGLVSSCEEVVVEPYVSTDAEVTVAAALAATLGRPVSVHGGDPSLQAVADRKDRMRRVARDLGQPLAPGEIVELGARASRPAEVADALARSIRRQSEATGRAIVKAAIGGSGRFTRLVGRSPEEARSAAAELCEIWDSEACVVESLVPFTVSPNLAFLVERSPGPIRWLGASDQRLDENLVHHGNIRPSVARTVTAMRHSSMALAGWLQDRGYAGYVGFDFVEHLDPASDEPRCFFAEVNPRVNSAVYPHALLERLNRRRRTEGRRELAAFLSGETRTGVRSFAQLEEAWRAVLFEPGCDRGIVPYATGTLGLGKAEFVAAGGSREEVEELAAGLPT